MEEYNYPMTTINTIDDLARILREQPEWVDTLRSLLLTGDVVDLPARFDRFIQSQEETNRHLSEMLAQLKEAHDDTRQRLIRLEENNHRLTELVAQQSEMLAELKEITEDNRQRLTRLEGRFGRMEGRFGNFEGLHYERIVRPKAMARSHINLGFDSFYIALSHEAGLVDPRLISAVTRATREKLVTSSDCSDLYEVDLIISDEGNRHAVFEVSLTADDSDIQRAKQRAGTLETITGGAAVPVVITSRIDDERRQQADAEDVTVFVIPYP